MSPVFISYKREDELRVGRLAKALEGAGFEVWWDRGLVGGENWRNQIQAALDAARCVIVVWTRESVGPAGDFVRDVAGQAKRRGQLVPVLFDRVSPPLGFGEIQAIDLTRWKGSPRDPFFQDLCAAVQAKLDGRAPPPPKGPMKRLLRRLTVGSVASALGVAVLTVGGNPFGVQERVCSAPVLQPRLADLCGTLGIGGQPTQAERLAWQAREPGNCAALRAHIERYPAGAYRAVAADLLGARRVAQTERWTPSTRRLALFVGQDGAPAANEAAARALAMHRAQSAAERLCKGFAATTAFRLSAARVDAQHWQCERTARGVLCGVDGEAECALDERHTEETETCGG